MIAGILLAAGASHRFGPENKLLAAYRGAPLVTHAAGALRRAAPDRLIAVVSADAVAALLDGFDIVRPDTADPQQSDSLRAGIAAAQAAGATRALVVLGDMPGVPVSLLAEILARTTDTVPAAATDGTRAMPPACFPASLFPRLLATKGDAGARPLLAALPAAQRVAAPKGALHDIDRPTDLSHRQT